MIQICKRCHRANPNEAVYCHHDGHLLEGHAGGEIPASGAAIDIGALPFQIPFILPSGQKCRNFNELALACHSDPKGALELLRAGHLEAFLAGQGRGDLARAARTASRAADRQRGLYDFLSQLPTTALRPPRLRVAPTTIDLGTVRPGEDQRCELVLHNDGMRLLSGTATCDPHSWLSLGDGPLLSRKLFQFSDRTVLPLRIVGKSVRAYRKPQEVEVQLESNGGTVTATVRLYAPVRAFPEGVLAGALGPRELASKAREAPKEAAALIESGAVDRWYQANGWDYPVRGPAAAGVAAVQQLFEALGLVKPPQVELGEDAIVLRGRPGEKIEYTLAVITQENRAAIAHGISDQPWLQVGRTIFRGRSAFLPLLVAAVPGRPGETLHAVLAVTSNGNQQFAVPVTLEVAGIDRAAGVPAREQARPAAAPSFPRQAPVVPVPSVPTVPVPVLVPVGAVVPAPAPVPKAPALAPPPPPQQVLPGAEPASGRSVWLTVLPSVLLILTLVGVGLRDYLADTHRPQLPKVEVLNPVPRLENRFHDIKQNDDLEKLWLTDPQPTMRFGVVTLYQGQAIGEGSNVQRLTFDPWGRTNNTCLRFDKTDERLFGGPRGSWVEREVRNWKDDQGQEREGVKSVWSCDDKKIEVTQFVELVRGEQSKLLDTCRVRYQIENRDKQMHEVGIRFLLDTFIGGKDGVPFAIPGEHDLCDTMKDLPGQAKDKKLPDFLQALEKPDLANPGTIAHLRLKLENLEPPGRVTLGAWPNEKLRVLVRKNADGPATLWDVPVLPLKSLGLDDSAIVIYWKEAPLEPGAKREVGFEYGLWNLASQGNRLAATVDGAFRPAGELTVIAYVNRSIAETEDETVTLTLPEGFKLLEGAETQPVPRLAGDGVPAREQARSGNVPVTWKIQAGATGKYDLSVKSSAGQAQTLPVEIKLKPIF